MSRRIFCALKILLRLLVLSLFTGALAVDYVIVNGIPQYLHYTYGAVMFVCSLALCMMLFAKYRKEAYLIFLISFAVYGLMIKFVPEIKTRHEIDHCMDMGNIWDYSYDICREDCWKWDDEKGCYLIDDYNEK